jgi:hypothetical protein
VKNYFWFGELLLGMPVRDTLLPKTCTVRSNEGHRAIREFFRSFSGVFLEFFCATPRMFPRVRAKSGQNELSNYFKKVQLN